ncbi:MAG: hypothetical protein QF437_10620 [Planctomycetota bacterium]|jgi:hypothetical protein|nr:hypothetical protein [Planctomycetota bacterium]MDP7130933.1 hypothetical protein [Planctomycetota bacterium]
MTKTLLVLFAAALAIAAVNAEDLVIAENGKCDYQVLLMTVTPGKHSVSP